MNSAHLLFIVIMILAGGISPLPLSAQQIKATVNIHTDLIAQEEQLYVTGLQQELARLVNNYQWLNEAYNYDLPLQIDILFERSSQPTTYHKYGAGIMMALPSGIQLRDRRWDFRYSRDDRLHFGEPYDTFTSLAEFYIWICLGFEIDRLAPLGGQPFYEKARLIAESARFETQYSLGWDYRRELITSLTQDSTYRTLRSAAYHAYAGIYYSEKGEYDQARSHLVYASDLIIGLHPKLIELHRDDHIIRFIDASQFAAALRQAQLQDVLDQLIRWDPDNDKLYK